MRKNLYMETREHCILKMKMYRYSISLAYVVSIYHWQRNQVVTMENGSNSYFTWKTHWNCFEHQMFISFFHTRIHSHVVGTLASLASLISQFVSVFFSLSLSLSFSLFFSLFPFLFRFISYNIPFHCLQSIKCLQILTLVLLTFQIRPYNYWVRLHSAVYFVILLLLWIPLDLFSIWNIMKW